MRGQRKPRRKAKASQIHWVGGKPIKQSTPKKSEMVPVFNDKAFRDAIRNRVEPSDYHDPPVVNEALQACMVPGGSVVATHDLCLGERGIYPFVALERCYRSQVSQVVVSKGSLLMYAGSIQTVERAWNAQTERYLHIQVRKHTFITPHGRCIIHDFSLIRPA